jgi:hypothetical protein
MLYGKGMDPDSGEFISSYKWSWKGPGSPVIDSPNSEKTLVYNLQIGTYTFYLRVTDKTREASGVDSMKVFVQRKDNKLPQVKIEHVSDIQLPTNKVTLIGSATDPDGSITSYSWKQIGGDHPSTIKLPSERVTDVTVPETGVYQFELAVTDNSGATGTARVKFTVYPRKITLVNIPPTAKAGEAQTITLPANSVTLHGTAKDLDGKIKRTQWKRISGPDSFQIKSPADSVTTVNNLVEGTYLFEFKVFDNDRDSAQDVVLINVQKDTTNHNPEAIVGKGFTVTAGTANVKLVGHGKDRDPNDVIKQFFWTLFSGDSTVQIHHALDSVAEITNLKPGTYEFQLSVMDNHGATGTAVISVEVETSVPPIPWVPIGSGLGLLAILTGTFIFFWLLLLLK